MSKPLLLLADDDYALGTALANRFKRNGFDVTQVTDSYNALANIVESEPNAIILDVNMPAGDGFTVQERLHKLGATQYPRLLNIPIIYLTGDKSQRLDEIAAELGAFAILHKPFEFNELLDTVLQALDSRTLPTGA